MEKIIFVLPTFKIGGGNKLFICLANELDKVFTHKVLIYSASSKTCDSPHLKTMLSINKNDVYETGVKYSRLISIFKLIKALKKLEGIIVVSDPIICSFLTFTSIKYVRFFQADDYHLFDGHPKFNKIMIMLYKLLQKISYRSTKCSFIVNSNFVRECLLKVPYKISPVYGVNISPALSDEYFRDINYNKFDFNNTSLVIGNVGRIHKKKGFKYFVDLANENYNSIEFLPKFITMSHDNLSNFDLRNIQVLEANNDEKCIEFYDKCDIFISTSLFEGFGMPPLEAMARGCVCILFDCKGFREYAVNGYNAIIVPVGAYSQLFDELLNVIKNVTLRRKISSAAIETAKKFTWNNTAINFEKLLKGKEK